ncbi:MAG TPA: glycerophosphodiester phosphodiesterase family protein [Allosphingosinicella sp.]|jgi:glycerophosphoryl diester phosphodiesterase
MPSSPSRRARLTGLISRPFAHRGLHGRGAIENSRAAFEAALAAGRGIELDVQASRDGVAFVFHDYELGRLTDARGKLAERSAGELSAIRLRGTQETIPTLEEVLALIRGRQGVLIEVKAPERRVVGVSRAVGAALAGYKGAVAVMSFNPEVSRWFASNAPETLRGLVVTEAGRRWRGWIARHLALWGARPDFLAYDIRDLPSSFAEAQRRNGLPVLTWTCRGDSDWARAGEHADQVIYEEPAR